VIPATPLHQDDDPLYVAILNDTTTGASESLSATRLWVNRVLSARSKRWKARCAPPR